MRASRLRLICVLALFIVVGIGLALHEGWGTLSSLGIGALSAICPLGALETLIASHTLIPPLMISLAVIAIVTLLVGRAFCSWGCPVPVVQDLVWGSKAKERRHEMASKAAAENRPAPLAKARLRWDSRFAVLLAALASTAVFGFPVFCLVCPIGLIFATFLAIWYLFEFNALTWGLLAFPLMIALEVLVLRKWCLRFCPLGALLSLVSRFNVTLRPRVDERRCLRTQGKPCSACMISCPQAIDLVNEETPVSITECTRCANCSESCPTNAIGFLSKRREGCDVPGSEAAGSEDERERSCSDQA